MKPVFADTLYFAAVINPRDPWHDVVAQMETTWSAANIVTTEEVLIEFLTAVAGGGLYLRTRAVQFVRALYTNPNVVVVPQSSALFARGMDLYEQRGD